MDSYPPLFRNPQNHSRSNDLEQMIKEEEEEEKTDEDDDGELVIPTIDLQRLDPKELEEACRNWGVFRLVNHGVAPTLLTQIQEQAKELFSLPFDYKQDTLSSPLSYFWGTPALTPSGSALVVGHQTFHWVEGLNVSLGHLSQWNTQDSLLHSYRNLLHEYGAHLVRIIDLIFGTIAERLGLDQAQAESYLSHATGLIRVYRYPHSSQEGGNIWGMGPHTDSSVLTILCQDQVGGLEVLKEEEWIPIKPVPDSFVINLGDMMQALSNDEYKSAVHRVKVSKEHDRLSLGYFVFPAKDEIIRSANYRPFTYNDFQASVQEDIKTLGYKVGLERFFI